MNDESINEVVRLVFREAMMISKYLNLSIMTWLPDRSFNIISDISVPYPACPKPPVVPCSDGPFHQGCHLLLIEVPHSCSSLITWDDLAWPGDLPSCLPHTNWYAIDWFSCMVRRGRNEPWMINPNLPFLTGERHSEGHTGKPRIDAKWWPLVTRYCLGR